MRLEVTATRATLEQRAALLAETRAFFAERRVLEVETPYLSRAAVSDPSLHSLEVSAPFLGAETLYLHTSPEFAMKRLLAAGVGDIFQICRVFRDGELGRWHQPEFCLLEWYRVGIDEHALMDEVEALLLRLVPERWPRGSRRVSYADAFHDVLGQPPDAPTPALRTALESRGVATPHGASARDIVDLAFAATVAPAFDPAMLTFVTDFPADQAALALVRGTPPRAARFEAFCGGLELANGFAELRDAAEQRRRFEQDLAVRSALGLAQPPLDEEFLAALAAGLPACAGVAVGFDRLIALATNAEELAEVLSLAHRPSS